MTAPFAQRRPAAAVPLAVVAALLAVVGWAASRALQPGGSGDFATVYAATLAWAAGGDPYATGELQSRFAAAGGPRSVAPDDYFTPSVYPPGTFAVVSPFTTVRWPVARAAWAAVNVGLTVAMLAVLPGLAGLRWSDPRGLLLMAAAVALGPTRVALSMGQPVVATTALVVLAAWAVAGDRNLLAGLLLAVGMALKPQVAGPFVAYYLLRRRWTLVAVAAVGLIAATAAGMARLWSAGRPVLGGLLANARGSAAVGAINDPAWTGPNRFSMVNLQVLLHTAIGSRTIVTALTAAAVLATAAAFALAVVRHRRAMVDPVADPAGDLDGLPARGLAELAFVAVWMLLPVYHRWYDGGLLVLVLAWAVAAVPVRRWTVAAAVAAATTVPFLASVAVHLLPGRRRVATRSSPLLEHLVLPNQCWALLAAAGLMLFVLWRRRPSTLGVA